jgi:hypothetical protein
MKSWVFALPVDVEVWAWSPTAQDYLPRLVTEAEAAQLVSETQRALAHWRAVAPAGSTPYTPPILVEHQRAGQRQGGILDARLAGAGDRRGVYLLADWTEGAWSRVVADMTAHVSIGTVPSYRDGDGETFGPLIDELSLTEHPRLKSIGTIQDTMALRLADALHTGVLMTPEEMMAKLEELAAMCAAQQEQINALMASKADEAEAEMIGEAMDAADEGAADEEKKDEGMALADQIVSKLTPVMTAQIEAQLKRHLGTLRLGDVGAPGGQPFPPARTQAERLAEAKRKGLKGAEAAAYALGN